MFDVLEDFAMDTQLLERHFAKIGARAKLRTQTRRNRVDGVSIDIGTDRDGEFFDIALGRREPEEIIVLDANPRMRHLVLMSREDDGKHKFLCGHDERHWFVAAVPEKEAVSTVATAMEALKPVDVRRRERVLAVKPRKRNRRRNEAFVRPRGMVFHSSAEASATERSAYPSQRASSSRRRQVSLRGGIVPRRW